MLVLVNSYFGLNQTASQVKMVLSDEFFNVNVHLALSEVVCFVAGFVLADVRTSISPDDYVAFLVYLENCPVQLCRCRETELSEIYPSLN